MLFVIGEILWEQRDDVDVFFKKVENVQGLFEASSLLRGNRTRDICKS
jgi:hypothetical protein